MALWIAAVSRLNINKKSSLFCMGRIGPMASMFSWRAILKSSHLTHFQLRRGVEVFCSRLRSMVPMIGKWSVWAGRSSGLVLHSMKAWRRAVLQKTLSGLNRLPVLTVSIVEILAGSSISIPKVPIRSTKSDTASRLAGVKRWTLFGSSQRGGVC